MTSTTSVRPTTNGRVIGLGLGKFRFVSGSGVALVLAAILPASALAGPEGANVAAGNATIRQNGNTTVIRAGDRTIIDYTRFNIGANETVRFVQPNANARVLNRIKGDAPTTIDGTLKANGIVYFANRAGVIFGPSAIVNVGGIYAAAGNISNSDFQAGLNRFTDISGNVTNAGQIDARFAAALVGKNVVNTGALATRGGIIAMVAGDEVTLSERGGVMSVRINTAPTEAGTPGTKSGVGVDNSGTISAPKGRTLMVAGDMYSLAVRNTGTVRARNIKIEGQGDSTVQVSGSLDASNSRGLGNSKGGSIQVTAKNVNLENATVNADGRRGGGEVLLGGDYQGNGTLRNATNTTVDADSTISANATQKGDGGTIIVWSDSTTNFLGQASANGGRRGGDGGLIETSGKINLNIVGAKVEAKAGRNGQGGLWLLDPVNVNIADPTGGDDTAGGTITAGIFDPDNSVSPAIVDAAVLTAALQGGTSVSIITGSVGTDQGNISVNAPLNLTLPSAVTLTLRAANDINVNSTITATGAGALNLNLFANADGSGNIDTNTASGNVFIGSAIQLNGGNFSTTGVNYTQSFNILTGGGNASILNTGALSITQSLDTGGGASSATLQGSSVAISGSVIAGSGGVTLRPANDAANIRINNGSGDFEISAATLANISATAGSTLTIGSATGTGNVLIGSGGAINLSAGNLNLALRGGAITFNNAITLNTARTLTLTGTSITDNTGTTDITAGTLALNISGATSIDSAVANLSSSGSGSLDINNNGNLTVGTLSASSITLTNAGTLSFAALTTTAGNLNIDSTAQADFTTIDVTGNLDIRTGGAIAATGAVNVTGSSTFVSRLDGGANITLSNTGNTFGSTLTLRSRNTASSADAAGIILVQADSAVQLGQVATTNLFSLTALGNISANNTVATGAAQFSAAVLNSTITISQLQASGTVLLNSFGTAGNVTLTNNQTLTIDGTSAIGGNLSLTTSAGNISVPALTLGGTTASFTTQGTDDDITVGTLTGPTIFNVNTTGSGGNATIAGAGNLTINAAVAGTLSFTSGGTTDITATAPLTLGASTSANTLSVTAPDLSLVGAVTVTTGDVTLQPDNDADTVGINSIGQDFTLSSADLLNIASTGRVTIGRSTGTGLISLGGAGAVNLAATNYNLTIRGGAMTFANALTLNNSRNLTLAVASITDSNVGTDFTSSGGSLTLNTTGAASLDAAIATLNASTVGGLLDLANTGNLDVAMLSAAGLILDTTGTINFTGNANVTGNLDVRSGGLISSTNQFTVTGTSAFVSRLDGGAGITLTNAANNFGTSLTLRSRNTANSADAAGNISVISAGPLTLAQVATTGTLDATAGGAISSTGTVATGAANISTGTTGGSITLNQLQSAGTVTVNTTGAGDVILTNNQTLTLGNTSTVGRNLSLTTTSGNLNVPNLTVNGTVALATQGSGDDISANNFTGATSFNIVTTGAGGDATFGSTAGIDAAVNIGGLLNFNATTFAQIAAVGPLTVGTGTAGTFLQITAPDLSIATSLMAGGNITLQPDNDSDTVSLNNTGGDFSLSAADLANISTSGTLTLGRAAGTGVINLGSLGEINLAATSYDLLIRGGLLTFNGGLTLSDDSLLTISTLNGIVSPNAGTDVTIGGTNGRLLVLSSNGATLSGSVATLAALVSGGTFTYSATGPLTIGSISANSGVSVTGGGDAIINTVGDLTLASSISAAGTGGVTINAGTGGVIIQSGSTIQSQLGVVNITASGDIAAPADTTPHISGTAINLTSTAGTIGTGNTLRTQSLSLSASGDAGVNIAHTGSVDATLNAASGLVTFSSTGAIITAGNWTAQGFQINAAGNIGLAHNVSATAGSATFAASGGAFSITSGDTLSVAGGTLSIRATDVAIDGMLSNPTGGIFFTRDTLGTIGVGEGTGDMLITKAELANITALLLGIGDTNTTRINVRNVQLADLTGITEIGFNAAADTGDVSFAGPAQVFRAMFAQADDSIIVDGDISATQGNLSLTANTDAMTDADNDRIAIADNITISTASPSGGAVSLVAAGIVGAGSFVINSNAGLTINSPISAANNLNLIARGGIVINAPGSGQTINISANDGVTISDDLTNNAGPTVINADADNNGTGTFTIAAGRTLNTTNNNLNITAADAVLDGSINVGTATLAITRSTAGTIGLGMGMGDLQLSNAELSRITTGTLSLGGELISSINIDSVAAPDTANISALIVLLASDVSILNSFNTSSASLAIARALDGSIALGQATGDMTISNAELQAITTNNLQIGGGGTRNITVNGVQLADLANTTGNINLISGQTITFQSNASTFRNLTATATDGMLVNANLSTSAGNLDLNGDSNNTVNTQDGISIASNRTLSASGGNLILRAQNGGVSGSGTATLEADGNVDLRSSLTTSGITTIRADKEANGTGNLISTGTIDASGSDISISAADVVLDGSINAGAGSLTITRSAAGTIGLGTATGDLTISGAELGRIIATDLTLGSSIVSQLTVQNVTGTNSNAIAGTTNLVARRIAFNRSTATTDTGTTFNQLDARASEGIVVDADLLTDLGTMRLDGNSDNVGNDFIALGGNLAAAIPPAGTGNITSPFNITLASDVQLTAATINFTGRDFNFLGKIDSAGSTARSLNLVSFGGGLTSFIGDIGTTGRLFTITTNDDGATRLFGLIRTNGTITFNDSVRIIEDTTIDVAGGAGVLFNTFVATGADAATERSLTVLTARTTNEGAINLPLISFARNVGQSRALRDLFLNFTPSADGRANVPGVATIIFRPRDAQGAIVRTPNPLPNFTVNLTGTFRMGQNEKLTSGGGLTINAPTSAFLGDIVSLGTLRVNSPAITLNRRIGGRLLGDQGGFGTDAGLDFVSAGNFDFTSVPTVAGSGRLPSFGTVDGGGDVRGTLSSFLFQAFGDILPASINSSGTTLRTLDLKSEGPTNTNIATTIAGAIPRESRTNDVGQDTTVSQALFEEIKQLGINPRNPTSGELLDQLSGSATFDDFPRRFPPTSDDYTTVVNRLPADRVTDLLTTYDGVMRKPLLDDSGNPVLDEAGKPQRADRRKEILDTFNASVRRYLESTGSKGDVDPAQFRAFLESDAKEAQSLQFVQQLEGLLTKLDQIGLTSREIIQAKASMLRAVRPRGFRTIDQFETMIRASSTKTARAAR